MTDLLTLKYIPISQAKIFGNNAKLHNLNQIIESITRYGFKSAAKWESTLNDGRGGIVAGNGRIEALRVMEKRGDDLPIGIVQDTETGEWEEPIKVIAVAWEAANLEQNAILLLRMTKIPN